MKPTIEWMKVNYDKFNKELFRGALGDCAFEVAPAGMNIYGYFKLTGYGVKAESDTRRIFVSDGWRKIYANHSNFVNLCKPLIRVNSNYSVSEKVLQNTLVHEMCHYYTYRNGYCPRQGHGKEFKEIARIIKIRSGGEFDVQTYAVSNDSNEYKAGRDDALKQKEERLNNNKLRNIKAYIWTDKDEVRLTTTSSKGLLERWFDYIKSGFYKTLKEIYLVDDINFNALLKENGMFENLRSIRYWDITNRTECPWLSLSYIKSHFNTKKIYGKENGFML